MNKNEKSAFCNQDYFAAANSGRGFVSFYGEIFNSPNIERRYLIKGGPGTGKSTFMRRVAEEASERGMHVVRYRCSSDPDSLDGIIINDRIALIDSTAPHAEEPLLVGARDVLVDLGTFWNSDGLYRERERIRALTESKGHAYSLAYRFLSSAMQSDSASRELIEPYISKKRLVRLARRLTREIGTDGGYECRIGLFKAIGMNGRRSLDTYPQIAQRVIYIEEHYGIAYRALCEICECARDKGCRISVSYDPLCPDYPDAVFFEESRVLFAVCNGHGRRGAISLRRMLDLSMLSKRERNELKGRSRYAKRLSDALVTAATDELCVAGDAHFALEEIYKAYMDFSSLDEYTSRLIKQIIAFAKR